MLWTLLYIIAGLAAAVVAWWKYMNGNKGYWPSRNVYLLDIDKEVAPFMDRLTLKVPFQEIERRTYQAFKKAGVKTYGGLMESRSPALLVLDLDIMKHILVKDFDYFINRRPSPVSPEVEPLMHKMLITAESQQWKDLRATLSPTFTTGKIRRMYQLFNECSNKLAVFLRYKTETSTEFEVRDIFTRYTTDVIASAAFGLDSQVFQPDTDSEFAKMTKRIQGQLSGSNLWKLVFLGMFPKLFGLLGIRLTDPVANDFFGDIIKKTIKHRESTGENRNDFLQLMLETKNITKDEEIEKLDTYEKDAVLQKAHKIPLTEELILSQSFLFFSAGFDTTESLLVLLAYELALNQDVQQKLYEAINAEVDQNGGELNYEAVMGCDYLDRVISETLRKYPPALRTERLCVKDYKVPNSDLTIEKGTMVIIPIYAIHVDSDYYPDPDKFDPDRFTAENKATRNPYSYLPFGHGPRNCIAMRFALTEAKSSMAHLIREFILEPSAKTAIPLNTGSAIGFKPEGGLFLSIKPRK